MRVIRKPTPFRRFRFTRSTRRSASSGGFCRFWFLAAALPGLLSGIGLQCFVHVIDYPIIVGGRPYFSLPSFIPPAYELTILFAAFTAVFGMLFLNGLPQPYHPVFNVPRFALGDARKILSVDRGDETRNSITRNTRSFMESLNAQEVFDVEE